MAGYAALCADDGDFPVAIRSSATSEDGSEASFAGLQDTYLWICGGDGVLHAVRDCWASLYSSESVSYRLRLKLPEEGLAMGVVVQRMVNSRCSGVMFTRSPLTGDRSVIAMEGSWGLGSAIVSGEVTPDKYVVNKVTGDIMKRTVSHKTVMHVPDLAAGGVREEPVPAERRDIACLSDEEIAELARVGKTIEGHYRCPQDIEWAFAPDGSGGESLYLLQSRPETIWANKDANPAATPKARAFDHVFDRSRSAGENMNLTNEDVEEIIRILDASTYTDLRLETGRFTLVLRRQGSGWTQESEVRSVPTSVPGTDPLTPERAPLASAVPAPPAAGGPTLIEGLIEVRTPIIGTFYRAPKPRAPPFVEVGSIVGEDTVVGIVETMKLMTSVYAGAAGRVVDIRAADGELVEAGHVLMRLERVDA